jgi:ATP-dependent Lhr-like helicase
LEHVARTLLKRWGVVFWRLLEREPKWLPPWRELLRVYRRLEARGEIRGGRFVAAMSGEQFALPEAVGLLREVRRRDKPGMLVAVSAADPLNLAGIAVPGSRVPALTGNRVLYRDGVPLAVLIAGDISFLQPLDPHALWQARNALVKRQVPPLLAYLG